MHSISSIAKGWDFLLLLSKVADGSDWKNMAGIKVLGVSDIDVGEKEFIVSNCCCSVLPLFYFLNSKRRRTVKVQHGQSNWQGFEAVVWTFFCILNCLHSSPHMFN